MRQLSTQILQHPFGVSNASLASQMYDVPVWDRAKDKREAEHLRDVAEAIRHLPGHLLGVNSGYREFHGAADGREAEWWSVISYDGDPL